MARSISVYLVLSIVVTISGCATTKVAEGPPEALDLVLVPVPRSVTPGSGLFTAGAGSEYGFDNLDECLLARLQDQLHGIRD